MLLGSLNNIFQDSLNKILSQQITHDRSYMSYVFNKFGADWLIFVNTTV